MAVFELLGRLAADGMAVLLVSHQLNLVARFAHRMVLLHRGHVAGQGTPADVMQASLLESLYEWPLVVARDPAVGRSEEHTSELQSQSNLVCRLLLEKKKKKKQIQAK